MLPISNDSLLSPGKAIAFANLRIKQKGIFSLLEARKQDTI